VAIDVNAETSAGGLRGVLRALVDTRDRSIQKARIQFGNRVYAQNAGNDEAPEEVRRIAQYYWDKFGEIEEQLDKDIAQIVAVTEPEIYKQLIGLKGIGPMLAAKLMSLIDIERSNTISQLWRFAGLAVIARECECVTENDEGLMTGKDDCVKCGGSGVYGTREYAVKGQRISYSIRLKTVCWQIGTSFMKARAPYSQIYYNARLTYDQTRPHWKPIHRQKAALRKMEKVFLAHLWERWRTVRGLSVREPYVIGQLGHSTLYRPEDYGWPNI
jgi:hypothetical protein